MKIIVIMAVSLVRIAVAPELLPRTWRKRGFRT